MQLRGVVAPGKGRHEICFYHSIPAKTGSQWFRFVFPSNDHFEPGEAASIELPNAQDLFASGLEFAILVRNRTLVARTDRKNVYLYQKTWRAGLL